MTDQKNNQLSARQLGLLENSFHRGSASQALAKWIGKRSVIEIDSLEQLPLEEATDLLATGEEPICFCSAEMTGLLMGEMILAFDDASGLALADLLLDQPRGTASEWTEMTTSAALETANILCCVYLNTLSEIFSVDGKHPELLPSPPRFNRDFAECLLEFALMGQAMANDQVILARTRFEIDEMPVDWTLLFVPDAQSMSRLLDLLPSTEPNEEDG